MMLEPIHFSRTRAGRRARRGLSLIELMLSLTITVMVAGAIASMLAAVSAGVGVRRDLRAVMVRASAAFGRLAAYVAPARCILGVEPDGMALWLHDQRTSDTVHGTEIRWFVFDAAEGAVELCFVDFPPTWTDAQRDLADDEHGKNSDWFAVLAGYDAQGLVQRIRLIDALDSVAVEADDKPQQTRLVSFELGFATDDGTRYVRATPSIRVHQSPKK